MLVNEYTVTWKLVCQWLFENLTKGRKFKFLILWCSFAVLSILGIVITGFSPFYILIFVYCVYMAILRDFIFTRKQYADSQKANGGAEWKRTVTITDTEIIIKEPSIEVKYSIDDVVGVTEKNDKIWLTLKNQKVVRMYLSAFVKGSWEVGKSRLTKTNLV